MMVLKYKEGTSTTDHSIITLDLTKSGVLNEDVRRRSQGSTSQSEVLVTENRGRNRERDGKGRDKSRSKFRSRYKNLECHHCGKKYHIKKYCFKLKRNNKGGGDKHNQNDEEKFEHATVTREDLLVIFDENSINLAYDGTSWVIDTSASIHVTLRRDFFTSYTPSDFGVLKMGNDGLVSVTDIRDVSLVSNNGTKLILKVVRHAQDIRLNLIFPGRLDDEGFCNTFSDGQWKLTKGSLVVARGKKSSNLYLMQALPSRDIMNVTVNDNSTELWHKRLSHMRKQRRVSFSSRLPHRKLELLELVHSDVCGPIKRKLVRSQDIVFIEDQTIDDIDKMEKEDSPDSGDLTDVNPDIGDFDAPIDDVVNDQQQAPIAPPVVPLRRSSRGRRSFVRGYGK
ncbi:hypothetical protein V6N12_007323 [Hibiscus sabdariffa]|uniref:Retrovirus-related Pol polyprotein from transposon TNT 1-94-like beta-barrel domain-containing protein n=1 Tax=Hibiscus sabdariffa TaxID=183260 RepID=A0ABR2F1H9_9ROSI